MVVTIAYYVIEHTAIEKRNRETIFNFEL